MAIFFVTSCSKEEDFQKFSEKMPVSVSIVPQKSIVEAIGGKYVNVRILVPPGKEPHDYMPAPIQILTIFASKAYFEIGMPFENIILSKIKKMEVKTDFVDMCKNAEKHTIFINEREVIDPHIWLSPNQLKVLSKNVLNEMIKLMPSHKAYFTSNYNAYIKRLVKIKEKLEEQLAPFKGKTFLVFHPAFGYFARDFGLKQLSVEIEGKEPTPRELLDLIKKAKTLNIKIVFVEPQFSKKSATALAKAIHGTVIFIDPLYEDILANFQVIADKLSNSFD